MKTIFRGWYESRNFSFDVYSDTKANAEKAIKKALKDHGKQHDLEPDWFYQQDVQVAEYKLNIGYRDHSEIKK